MARRHKRYGDIVALPFAGAMDIVKSSVKGTDVIVGALAALGGIFAVNFIKSKSPSIAKAIPASLQPYMPAVAGVLAGVGLYMVDKKVLKNSKGAGHAVGAIGAGIAITALSKLKAWKPAYFADTVDLQLAGLLIDDAQRGGFAGLLVDDRAPGLAGYADAPGLGDLAALSLQADDDIETLVG